MNAMGWWPATTDTLGYSGLSRSSENMADFDWKIGVCYLMAHTMLMGLLYLPTFDIYHKNQANVGKYTIHGWYG